MTTCRTIITRGLQMARVVGIGRDPRAAESELGLETMQGMYDAMFAGAMFGRLTDVYKSENYTAKEGERIYNDGATITIPTTITDDGDERAPRDLSAIVVIASGLPTNRVYSNGAWRNCSALSLDSDAPFAERDAIGLSALLATDLAGAFGQELPPMWRMRGLQFKGSLSYKLGSTQPEREGVYF